jgi:hypothetical protein
MAAIQTSAARGIMDANGLAQTAYEIADAMMKERAK